MIFSKGARINLVQAVYCRNSGRFWSGQPATMKARMTVSMAATNSPRCWVAYSPKSLSNTLSPGRSVFASMVQTTILVFRSPLKVRLFPVKMKSEVVGISTLVFVPRIRSMRIYSRLTYRTGPFIFEFVETEFSLLCRCERVTAGGWYVDNQLHRTSMV